MMMERQGSGFASAMAAALRRRDALYTANLTPAQIAQLDLSNKSSLEALVTVVSAVAMALITSTVVLRLTVRRYSVGRFFLDDYLVILASLFTLVVCAVVIAATKYGLGQHVWNLNFATILDDLKVCIQLMFVANIFYAAAIAFTKLSIIASYLHIFAPRGLLKTTLYATACVTIGLGVASVPATIFECIPVAGAWSLSDSDAHCYTFVNFLFASTAINVTTDLILCIVPIPLFWRLQLPQRQKIMISVLFFLGGFACIASIIRLAYLHLLYDPIDVTYDLVSSVMWTIAECTIGIVCVSLPPLRSLFAKFWPGVFGNVNNAHSSRSGGGGGGLGAKSPMSPLSPHHPYARQPSNTMNTLNTIGSNRRSIKGSKSAADVGAIAMSSLPSRHSRHSLHSSDFDDDEEEDTSSHGRLAHKLEVSMSPSTVAGSNSGDEVELTALQPAIVMSEKEGPQRRPASDDVEMGIVHSPDSSRPDSAWNVRHHE